MRIRVGGGQAVPCEVQCFCSISTVRKRTRRKTEKPKRTNGRNGPRTFKVSTHTVVADPGAVRGRTPYDATRDMTRKETTRQEKKNWAERTQTDTHINRNCGVDDDDDDDDDPTKDYHLLVWSIPVITSESVDGTHGIGPIHRTTTYTHNHTHTHKKRERERPGPRIHNRTKSFRDPLRFTSCDTISRHDERRTDEGPRGTFRRTAVAERRQYRSNCRHWSVWPQK